MTPRFARSGLFVSSIALLVSLLSQPATAQDTTVHHGDSYTRITRLFVNLTGDPKITRHLYAFLQLELEDVGIEVVESESRADAELDGNLVRKIRAGELNVGVLHLEVASGNDTKQWDDCGATANGIGNDLFNTSAGDVAASLRDKYPNAAKILIDPASDLSASEIFGASFESFLRKSKFELVKGAPFDLRVKVRLEIQKVKIDQDDLLWDLDVRMRDGNLVYSEKGSTPITATASTIPTLCGGSLHDLSWLSGRQDQVFELARSTAKSLTQNNAQVKR